MDEFNYFFRETPHGVICAHTYQYEPGRSTWIFEMDEACWRGHGFTETDEEGSRRVLEALYAEELQGHPLLLNRSHWRRFPRIACRRWSHGNVVLLGDAKASAHFSIGSGTKLAMECAIALSDAVVAHGETDVAAAFAAYDKARRGPCEITQHNADVSLAWFEHMGRSWDMEPEQFAMVVMCRAKAITYDNLAVRDPAFVARVDDAFYARVKRETGQDHSRTRPTPMFTPFRLRDMEVQNRVAMAPMAQYSAGPDGVPTDWHFVHYTSHALGGAGLVFTEMTCPSPDARITPACTGLWSDAQEAAWTPHRRVRPRPQRKPDRDAARSCRPQGSTQLGWERMDHPLPEGNWPLVSASAIPYLDGVSQVPAALDRAGMDRIRDEFVGAGAARRAGRVRHAGTALRAHGYLFASFLSPLTNRRDDAYGGSIENRLRYPLEVFSAMREVWPAERPMSVRISATDWSEGGIGEADTVAIAEGFSQAAATSSTSRRADGGRPAAGLRPDVPVQFAEVIRNVPRLATMAVGAITEAAQVNTILHTRRADLVALGRPHLWNPAFAREGRRLVRRPQPALAQALSPGPRPGPSRTPQAPRAGDEPSPQGPAAAAGVRRRASHDRVVVARAHSAENERLRPLAGIRIVLRGDANLSGTIRQRAAHGRRADLVENRARLPSPEWERGRG